MAANSTPAAQVVLEGQLLPQADSLYLLGQQLGEYNAQGLFATDLSQSASFSAREGKWLISPAALIASQVDVIRAGKQFTNIDSIITTPLKIALLGGYINKTSLLIDPSFPGFTQRFLEDYHPGLAITAERSDLAPYKPLHILLTLGFEIRLGGQEPELISIPFEGPREELSKQDILVTSLILLFLEINISPWIEAGEKAHPQSAMFRIMGGFLRKEHLKEARFTGFLPRLFGIKGPQDQLLDLFAKQPLVAQLGLGVIKGYIENPVKQKNIGERISLLTIVHKIFEVSANPLEEDKLRFLETFSHGLSCLAQKAEREGNLYESVSLYQTAHMVTQWLSANNEDAQLRLNRIVVKEGQLGWRSMSIEQINSIDLFMSICTFAQSASLTDLLYFKQGQELFKKGKRTNQLWSSLMRAIDRGRWILHLMDKFTTSPLWSKEVEDSFKVIFTHILKQFGDALYLHLTAAQLTVEKKMVSSIAQCWLTEEGQESFVLKKELKQTKLLLETLSKEGLSESTMSAFKVLLQINPVEASSVEGIDTDRQIKEFNALLKRYHAKEENLSDPLLTLLTSTQDEGMHRYSALLIMLIATKEKQWNIALDMASYLHDTIPQAWDLPGIPVHYLGAYMGEEILSIDPVLDALRTISEQLPAEQVIKALLDRYLERYTSLESNNS